MEIEFLNGSDCENEFDENEVCDFNITLDSFSETITYPMDMSVALINEWDKRHKFDLDPEFQRRSVWDKKRRSKFIESLIMGVPIPSILLATSNSSDKYIVIDGKQRLQTILNFMSEDNSFKLTGLEVLKELENKNYQALRAKGELNKYLFKFEDAILKTSIIKNYNDDILYFVFNRLNTGSVPLSTQELRQTLYPGEFIKYVNEFALHNPYLMKILGIKKPDKRMKDSELVIRYFAFKLFRDSYGNNINEFFNNTCKQLNANWEQKECEIKKQAEELNNAIEFVYSQCDEDSFRAYLLNNKSQEYKFGPVNRPMFDLLTAFFSVPDNRELFKKNELDLLDIIKKAFETNKQFYDAFLPTTHSKEKTDTRFRVWEDIINSYR